MNASNKKAQQKDDLREKSLMLQWLGKQNKIESNHGEPSSDDMDKENEEAAVLAVSPCDHVSDDKEMPSSSMPALNLDIQEALDLLQCSPLSTPSTISKSTKKTQQNFLQACALKASVPSSTSTPTSKKRGKADATHMNDKKMRKEVPTKDQRALFTFFDSPGRASSSLYHNTMNKLPKQPLENTQLQVHDEALTSVAAASTLPVSSSITTDVCTDDVIELVDTESDDESWIDSKTNSSTKKKRQRVKKSPGNINPKLIELESVENILCVPLVTTDDHKLVATTDTTTTTTTTNTATTTTSSSPCSTFFMDPDQKRLFEALEQQKKFKEGLKRQREIDREMFAHSSHLETNSFFQAREHKQRELFNRLPSPKECTKEGLMTYAFHSEQPHFPSKASTIHRVCHPRSVVQQAIPWIRKEKTYTMASQRSIMKPSMDIKEASCCVVDLTEGGGEDSQPYEWMNHERNHGMNLYERVINIPFWLHGASKPTFTASHDNSNRSDDKNSSDRTGLTGLGSCMSEEEFLECMSNTWHVSKTVVQTLFESLRQSRNAKPHHSLVDKYQPCVYEEGSSCNLAVPKLLFQWLNEWKGLRLGRHEERSYADELYAYDSDHSDESNLQKLFVLSGQVGSGKTSCVYRCAEQLGYQVIEINAGQLRSGKTILDLIGEATQSNSVLLLRTSIGSDAVDDNKEDEEDDHDRNNNNNNSNDKSNNNDAKKEKEKEKKRAAGILIKKKKKKTRRDDDATLYMSSRSKKARRKAQEAKQVPFTQGKLKLSLILFEDVDIMFEEDHGFFKTLKQLTIDSRCPLVATCADVPSSLDAIDRVSCTIQRPLERDFCLFIQIVCFLEGIEIDSSGVKRLGSLFNRDLRLTLQTLHVWGRGISHQTWDEKSARTPNESKDLLGQLPMHVRSNKLNRNLHLFACNYLEDIIHRVKPRVVSTEFEEVSSLKKELSPAISVDNKSDSNQEGMAPQTKQGDVDVRGRRKENPTSNHNDISEKNNQNVNVQHIDHDHDFCRTPKALRRLRRKTTQDVLLLDKNENKNEEKSVLGEEKSNVHNGDGPEGAPGACFVDEVDIQGKKVSKVAKAPRNWVDYAALYHRNPIPTYKVCKVTMNPPITTMEEKDQEILFMESIAGIADAVSFADILCYSDDTTETYMPRYTGNRFYPRNVDDKDYNSFVSPDNGLLDTTGHLSRRLCDAIIDHLPTHRRKVRRAPCLEHFLERSIAWSQKWKDRQEKNGRMKSIAANLNRDACRSSNSDSYDVAVDIVPMLARIHALDICNKGSRRRASRKFSHLDNNYFLNDFRPLLDEFNYHHRHGQSRNSKNEN